MRPCSVCVHARRPEIDKALLEQATLESLAGVYGMSVASLCRHRQRHVPALLRQAKRAEVVAQAGTLFDQVEGLRDRALGILGKAEGAGSLAVALTAIREIRGILELLGKLAGDLQSGSVTINLNPEWINLRMLIVNAVQPFPEARQALLEVFSHLQGDNDESATA